MSDTLTPERIAELRKDADYEDKVPKHFGHEQKIKRLSRDLLFAAEETATLRAERDRMRQLVDTSCEEEDEIHQRLDAVLPPDTLLTVTPLMGGRTPLCGDDGRVAQLVAENARLRDLLARVQANRWMPIETAPKDGSLFMAYKCGVPCFGSMKPSKRSCGSIDGVIQWEEVIVFKLHPQNITWNPTHWRPLPPTPAEESEGDTDAKV